MNKPSSWTDLPNTLLEVLLWDMDLDYCSYESSKAETIHEILNGNPSVTNSLIISNYYKALSVETLCGILNGKILALNTSLMDLYKLKAKMHRSPILVD
jgi:hypothetical protein